MTYLNSEHYSDPTAGPAVARVARETQKYVLVWGRGMARDTAGAGMQENAPAAPARSVRPPYASHTAQRACADQ